MTIRPWRPGTGSARSRPSSSSRAGRWWTRWSVRCQRPSSRRSWTPSADPAPLMSPAAPGIPPLSPSREEFRALAAHGNLIPVYVELAADLDTPLSAFLRLRPGPYAFLLESVEGGEKWARYSFLGSDPLMVFTAKGKRISVRRADGTIELLPGSDPFTALRDLLAQFKPVPVPGLPR